MLRIEMLDDKILIKFNGGKQNHIISDNKQHYIEVSAYNDYNRNYIAYIDGEEVETINIKSRY